MIRIGLALALLVAAAPAVAQTRQLHTKVTPIRAFMGDVVTLEIDVVHDADDRLTVPRGLKMRPFQVLRRRTQKGDADGDRVRETVRIDLEAFEMGELVVPSIELRLVHPDGRVETLRTDPARVTIAGRLDGVESAEPKGNHGPVAVLQDRMWPLWVGLFVLLAIVQIFVIRAILRRRMRLRPVAAPAPPPLPPWEVALTKLAGIERSALVDKGLAKEHYDAVSDVIREYLGALGGFEGLESTTEEILSIVRERVPAGVTFGELLGFFAECDLVKFARAATTPEQSKALLDRAVLLVAQTRDAALAPLAAPPPVPAPPPAVEARP